MAVWLVSFLRLPIFNSILTWGKIGDIILKKKFMGYNDNVRVHYSDVIMSTMVSQITGVSIVYSTVCSGADQRKHHWPLWGEFTAQISHKMGNQMKSWFTYRVNKFIRKILAEMTLMQMIHLPSQRTPCYDYSERLVNRNEIPVELTCWRAYLALIMSFISMKILANIALQNSIQDKDILQISCKFGELN